MVKKSFWAGTMLFAICLLILFPFSLGVEVIQRHDVQVGCFWSMAEFVAALTISRMFAIEIEGGALEFLISSRAPTSAILFGKIFSNAILIFTILLTLYFFWILFFNACEDFPPLFILFLFSLGSASLGSLIHGITTRSLGKEILQPILFFPLQTGILLASVQLHLSLFQEQKLSAAFDLPTWWSLLILYPVIFCSLVGILGTLLLEE